MKDLLQFSKFPQVVLAYREWKFVDFFKFYGINILLLFIVSPLLIVLLKLTGIQKIELSGISHTYRILFVVFLAPILEELMFRLVLRKNKYNLSILLFVSLTLILWGVYREKIGSVLFSGLFLFMALLLFLEDKSSKFDLYSERNYKILYWGSIICFALLHGGNFSYPHVYQMLLVPFIVLPQFFGGVILSYVRVHYGIVFSILMHVLFNLSALWQ